MSSVALRRSRRALPKKPENFLAGQIVEFNRFGVGETIKVKLSERSSEVGEKNPRWMADFADGHMEEVWEHRLGKVLVRAPGEVEVADNISDSRRSSASNSPVVPPPAEGAATTVAAPVKKGTGRASPHTNSTSSGKNSPSSETDADGKKKSVSFHHHHRPQDTTTSTASASAVADSLGLHQEDNLGGAESADRVSTREERSRRRQAMIDEVPGSGGDTVLPVVVPPPKRKGSDLSNHNSSSNGNNGKNNSKNSGSRKRHRHNNNHDAALDEPVTKVKFLTGTLLLYRGRHRRAEFVRRV